MSDSEDNSSDLTASDRLTRAIYEDSVSNLEEICSEIETRLQSPKIVAEILRSQLEDLNQAKVQFWNVAWPQYKATLAKDVDKLEVAMRNFRARNRIIRQVSNDVLDKLGTLKPPDSTTNPKTPPPTSTISLPTPKLPTIHIPCFDGDLK